MFQALSRWSLLALFVLGCQPYAEIEEDLTSIGAAGEVAQFEEAAPVLTQGKHRFTPRPVEPPPLLYKLNRKDIPDYQNQTELKKAQIDILVKDFVLNVDQSTMEVQVKVVDLADGGKVVGEFTTKGDFDKTSEDWQADLEPMDQAVRALNQVHVKALCILPFVCDQIVMDVRYRKDGKIFKKQFQTKIKPAHIAQGDGEGELIEIPSQADVSIAEFADKAIEIPGEMQLPQPKNELFREQSLAPNSALKEPQIVKESQARVAAKKEPVKTSVKIESKPKPSPPPQASVPEKLPPIDQSLVAQAKGWHDRGRLVKASLIPLEGLGFRRRHASGPEQRLPVWSTEFLKNILEDVGEQFHQAHPGRSMLLGSVSGRYGGKLGRHASHQTGLDVDIYYQKTDGTSGVFNAVQGGKLVKEFDVASNWVVFKLLVSHPDSATMVVFVDQKIKKAMCAWAKENNEDLTQENSLAHQTLRRLIHWQGHANHFHVRLVCPSGPAGDGCAATRVSLPNGTGCG